MPKTTTKPTKPVSTGLSRRKGHSFERKIAAMLRERFPEHEQAIRRSYQSRAAEESDVTGLPGFWIECQDASQIKPVGKLEQAERDRAVAVEKDPTRSNMIPIAITHLKRASRINVTLRLADLLRITGPSSPPDIIPVEHLAPVTIDLEHFIPIARRHVSEVVSKMESITPAPNPVDEPPPAPSPVKRMKRPNGPIEIIEETGVTAIEVPFLDEHTEPPPPARPVRAIRRVKSS